MQDGIARHAAPRFMHLTSRVPVCQKSLVAVACWSKCRPSRKKEMVAIGATPQKLSPSVNWLTGTTSTASSAMTPFFMRFFPCSSLQWTARKTRRLRLPAGARCTPLTNVRSYGEETAGTLWMPKAYAHLTPCRKVV